VDGLVALCMFREGPVPSVLLLCAVVMLARRLGWWIVGYGDTRAAVGVLEDHGRREGVCAVCVGELVGLVAVYVDGSGG
jgi:hypothetical protein